MRNFYLRHVDRTKLANIPFRPDSCKDVSRASVTICNHFTTTLSNDSQFWMDFDFCHFMLCRIGKYKILNRLAISFHHSSIINLLFL